MKEDKKIHDIFLKDKLLGEAARKYGLPDFDTYGRSGPLMTLIESVVSQQLSDKAAKAIFVRLESFIDRELPGIEDLAGAGREKLRELGMSGSKADTIVQICKMTKEGSLKLNLLKKMSDHEAASELIKIKGIGEWTAQMFLIFGLKRKDVWPSSDFGIRKVLTKLLLKKEILPAEKVETYGKRWAPYRSYAALYIWKS